MYGAIIYVNSIYKAKYVMVIILNYIIKTLCSSSRINALVLQACTKCTNFRFYHKLGVIFQISL